MECWCGSKHKSWFYWLLIFMMMPILMVQQIQGGCIEDERKALLEIKTSLVDSYDPNRGPLLPTWVDDGSAGGRGRSECCDWERVKCNTTTGHVTNLSLSNMLGLPDDDKYEECKRIWPLNISLFLHFKELRSLNLSFDCLDNGIVSTGLERLSSLKKLEILDLSWNSIDNDIFPSLGALTSLRALHLNYNNLEGYFPALALENLEILDLSHCNIQGFERISMLRKLEILNLRVNVFNESLITSLSALPSLKALDLSGNYLHGSFPAQGLSHLTNMEKLDLSFTRLNNTPSIQDCKSLSRLKRLESISLGYNDFDKSIISCLSFLPSLKTLDLSCSLQSLEGSFPIQGMF